MQQINYMAITTPTTINNTTQTSTPSGANIPFFGTTSTTTPTVAPSLVSPIVQSSKMASENKDSFGNFMSTQKQTINNQSQVITDAKTKLANDAAAKAKADADAKLTSDQFSLEKQKVDALTAPEAAKYANGNVIPYGEPGSTMPKPENLGSGDTSINNYNLRTREGLFDKPTDSSKISTETVPAGYKLMYDKNNNPVQVAMTSQEQTNYNLDKATTDFNNATQQMVNGTFPLNDLQKAQLKALESEFTKLIADQKTTNANFEGIVARSANLSGESRYSPDVAAGNIAKAVSDGTNKIVSLQSQMASALAKMQSGFESDNYDLMNEAYKTYTSAQKDIQTNLDNMKEQATKEVETLNAAKAKVQAEVDKNKADILKSLAPGTPASVIDAINNTDDIGEMVSAAGDYAINGTGAVADYQAYRADAVTRGLTPMSYNEYQTMDANRKAKAAATAGSMGLSATVANTALKLSDDYEARSKDYYQQRDAYNRIIASASEPSAAGDLALIFNYMKVLDPGSTVREGEFANAQNSGSVPTQLQAQYNKIINGQRLTEDQRTDFVDRAGKLFTSAKKQQDSVANEFKAKAEKYGVPADLVIRETGSTSILNDQEQGEQAIKSYVASNPQKADALASMVETYGITKTLEWVNAQK